MSFENLFTPSGRQESAGLILAECCGSIGLKVKVNFIAKPKLIRTGLQTLWPQNSECSRAIQFC